MFMLRKLRLIETSFDMIVYSDMQCFEIYTSMIEANLLI